MSDMFGNVDGGEPLQTPEVPGEFADIPEVSDTSDPSFVTLEGEFDEVGEAQPNLCEPGTYATDSITARGPEQSFTEDERAAIDTIGYTDGCHSCGTTDPGTKSGHFIPDHQPPSSLCEEDQPQELYPQCLGCSNEQGGVISTAIRQ